MDRTQNPTPEPSLNPCNPKGPVINSLNFDSLPHPCAEGPNVTDPGKPPSLKNVPSDWGSWFDQTALDKTGIGQAANSDPVMTGQIINDPQNPNPSMLYRYSQALRGADEAIMDLFRNVIVIDENSKVHPVPIIYATQEKAVAYVLQDNTRKDNTLVVDRVRLPLMAVHATDIQLNQDRYTYSSARNVGRNRSLGGKPGYTVDEKFERDTIFGISRGIPIDISFTLYIWTLYLEDMNQILEQILLKFNPVAYINIRGINWEVIVKLDSIGNNIETEPGDQAVRVIKYQFNMTAESYIPQPILRQKAVLKINEEFVNSTEDADVSEVLDKIEIAVKELE